MGTLQKSAYQKLVKDISVTYEHARRELVAAYWKIGKRIVEVEQGHALKAEYGTALIERLSGDLTAKYGAGFSVTNVRNMRALFLAHPIRQPAGELSWSQYVTLLTIKDETVRKRLEKKVAVEQLSKRDVQALVKESSGKSKDYKNDDGAARDRASDMKSESQLAVTRGALYTYAVKEVVKGARTQKVLDLGFNMFHETCVPRQAAGTVVRSVKQGSGYRFRALDAKTGALMRYTYKAYVERVIDGDTLLVYIALGFGLGARQRVRLRGIDAPEIDTNEGKRARQCVVRALAQCPFIVIKTEKSDKYDRYLSDVFYLPKCMNPHTVAGEGNYLNQVLVDKGLAGMY